MSVLTKVELEALPPFAAIASTHEGDIERMPFSSRGARGSRRGGTSTKRGGRLLVCILISPFVALLVLEAILRFGLGLGNPILIQPDAACSYILKPNQNVFRFFVRTHVNRFAMRSEDVSATPRPGMLRVMFLGDSITYGTTQVDQASIFTEVLHRDLPAIVHRPVEVLNASAGAWAPDNELSFIQSRGAFQSEIVFLVLNDGDLSQPRSLIADVGDGLPVQRPATALGELYSRYLRPSLTSLVERKDAGDSVASNTAKVIFDNLAVIEKIEGLVESQGARLIIVYIPFRKDIPQVSEFGAETLHSWCKEHRVAMADMTATEAAYTSREITLDSGIHLNARGHLAVAKALERSWPELVAER